MAVFSYDPSQSEKTNKKKGKKSKTKVKESKRKLI
jgi:hypothetical protein